MKDKAPSIFTEKISKLIGSAVRERRKGKGMTWQELARQSRVSYGTIVNTEKCHKLPTLSVISNVLPTLNLRFKYIVKNIDPVFDSVLCVNNERADINIGDVIIERRTEIDMSLEVLARKAMVLYNTVLNMERGNNLHSLNVLLKILDKANLGIIISERI